AWEQTTHMAINYEAIKNFIDMYGEDEKYINSPLTLEESFKGLYVISSTLFADEHIYGAFGGYEDKLETKTFSEWIMHGGYSADEPNIYESLRHFYDPFEKNNAKHLVAQANSNGGYIEVFDNLSDKYINPEIDARLWGLSHEQNPYSFAHAIDYYYEAMTTSEFSEITGFDSGVDNFRISTIPANDAEEKRSLYLGAAFRAVGETMHLMADMTQPAHVRNDSHPFVEPIEQGTTPDMVKGYAENGLNVESQIGKEYYCETFENRQSLNDLFHKTAVFTNETMFSIDTISDVTLNIKPANGLEAYASPQVTGLIEKDTKWSDFGSLTTYYKTINGIEVPMLYKNIAGDYKIATSYAQKQSEVLIPVAIAACTEVLDRFFPTMEVLFEKGDEEFIQDKRDREIEVIPFKIAMVHHYEEDIEWYQRGMEIKYQGPGELIIQGEKETRRIPIFFEDGKVMAARNKNEDILGDIALYRKNNSRANLTKEQKFFEVDNGDMVWVEISAGARFYETDKIFIEAGDYKIKVDPEKPYCYEETSFTLTGTGNEQLFYVWDFGDDSDIESGEGKTEEKHIYNRGGDYKVTVSVYKNKGDKKIVAKAFELVVVDNVVDVEILPSNNLIGIPGTSSEISVKSIDERISLDNYRIEWDIKGLVVEPNGEKAILTFDEMGEYDIYARIYNVENKEVGRAYASLEVSENTDVITVEPTELVLGPFDGEAITVYLNGEELSASQVEFSVVEGDEGGYFSGAKYYAPGKKGNYTIKVIVNSDEGLTAYVPVTVNVGVWKLVKIETEIKEPSFGSDSYPDYSGEIIHNDGEYRARIIYDGDFADIPDYDYTITANWGEIPKELIPGEMLDIDISMSVNGNYKSGRNSMDVRFFTEDYNMKIGSESVIGEKEEEAITISGTIPHFGSSYKEAEALSIRVLVDPFYQYLGRVMYYYIYEYIVE
ncbi:MAG: PKD domain-containing protein, partial [Clostridiales bacterium]|nr:PKD domain-containing protein [Clostridiales bacterium]